MYKVIEKEILNPTVTKMVVEAPAVAKKALAVYYSACARGWGAYSADDCGL